MIEPHESTQRLMIASNRLPFVIEHESDDQWHVKAASGGLVTALAPVLRDRGGIWIGWPGTSTSDEQAIKPLLDDFAADAGYSVAPVALSAEDHEKFYLGFANAIIWPLFHDLQSMCHFEPSYWQAYEQVNQTFAHVIAEQIQPDDFLWVHDYHLMNVAENLRHQQTECRSGFFLHIPFPPPDIFLKLPWRARVLDGLLAYSLVGFHTARDLHNFVQCVQTLLKDVGVQQDGDVYILQRGTHTTHLGVFPIGIDFNEFALHAASPDVADTAWRLREALPHRQLILGVDRLDYTKGIPERLAAFRRALTKYPDLHGQITFVQVVIPSRTDIAEYADLKTEIERLVGEINGQFTQPGWVPIHYLFRSLNRTELVAYYRSSEIALITPLKDGMNLVAKEYCASSIDSGVLILSEFAGAAPQLEQGALMVNPYDIEGVADAIYHAWSMPDDERRTRLQHVRTNVREQDVHWWVNTFLATARASEADC